MPIRPSRENVELGVCEVYMKCFIVVEETVVITNALYAKGQLFSIESH